MVSTIFFKCLEVLLYILISTQATSLNCFLLVCDHILHSCYSLYFDSTDVKRTKREKAAIPTHVKTVCVSVRGR